MTETTDRLTENYRTNLGHLEEATSLTREEKRRKLVSQIEMLVGSDSGLRMLYQDSLRLEAAGIFEDTPWQNPNKLVPPLVRGTLLAGGSHMTMEILSELRLLAYLQGKSDHSAARREQAKLFLEEALVHNLDFAFGEFNEESRSMLGDKNMEKLERHFGFLLDHLDLTGIKAKLALELEMLCAQRPVVTRSIRKLITTIHHKIELNTEDEDDRKLQAFVDAVFFPSAMARRHPDIEAYKEVLARADDERLREEAQELGRRLHRTGLTNPYLAIVLEYAIRHRSDLVPVVLHLNPGGEAQWHRYGDFAGDLALSCYNERNTRGIYGFKRMLERHLFSRRAVRAGLTNLRLTSMHPEVKRRIIRSVSAPQPEVTAMQYLLGALMGLLGQPLGIGQGNNATCQSARGISLWAQHAPAKLLTLLNTVVTSNNLIVRFENADLESIKLGKGLVDQLDYQLDALSVVLVPHLDKVYNEMMRRASGRGEDPHKWVNPALYGHWISAGFASAYSYLTQTIQDYDGFVRLFYAAFHPDFNGGREMVYPNPIGIFITSSTADMLGFHAVSLQRIAPDPQSGQLRAYFLNPNNEGRQDWGQNIKPSVFGRGEKHGESSLPLHEFVSRIYAFHFNRLHVDERLDQVSEAEIEKVRKLAEAAWGRAYTWSNLKKVW